MHYGGGFIVFVTADFSHSKIKIKISSFSSKKRLMFASS